MQSTSIEKGIIFTLSEFWQVILPIENRSYKQRKFFPIVCDSTLKTGQLVQFSQTDGVVDNITITTKKASNMEVLRTAIFVHERNVYQISVVGFGSGADNICSTACSVSKNEMPVFKRDRKNILDLFRQVKQQGFTQALTPITFISRIKVCDKEYNLFSSMFSTDYEHCRVNYDLFGNKYVYTSDGGSFASVDDVEQHNDIAELERHVRQDQCLSKSRRAELAKIEHDKRVAQLKREKDERRAIKAKELMKKKKKEAKERARAERIQAEKNRLDELHLRREELKREMEFQLKHQRRQEHLREQQLGSKKHQRNLNRMNSDRRRKKLEQEQREREEAKRERRRQQQEYWRRQSQYEKQRRAVNSAVYSGAYKGANPYHILGITYHEYKTITPKEIDKRYKRQFLRWHPDKHHHLQTADPALYQKYTDISKMVSAAKEVLFQVEKATIDIFLGNPYNWTKFNPGELQLFNSI